MDSSHHSEYLGDLLTETELRDDLLVRFRVVRLEVVQKATTAAHHHEEATAGGMVFLVILEVLGQLTDTLAQNGDLDLRASGVVGVGGVLTDDLLLSLGC
jgi:hypothetical protein